MNIEIKKGGLTLKYTHFIFPGGEIGVKLDVNNLAVKYDPSPYTIIAHLQNSQDVLSIAMIKDALERWDDKAVCNLFMPYIPYARQDRVCVPGEAFSLKVFANYINSLNFNKVIVADPHSDVSAAVFNKLEIISQFNIIDQWRELNNRIRKTILISPDSGSNKKTSTIASYFDHKEFIRADKLRNLATGEIKETIIYCDELNGADVTILDDCCDGGFTFIQLAKVLKAKGAGKVILYVTHGIFSKGLDALFDSGIDEIWTTNSFRTVEGVNTVKLEELFKI